MVPHLNTPLNATATRFLLVVAGVSLVAACEPTSTPITPSLAPTEEAVPLLETATPFATATFAPLTEATEPIVLDPNGALSTPTAPAVPPVNLPDNPIAVFHPGPGSQVVSPFRLIGRAGPSFEERVLIRLFGEEGQLLHEKTTILFAYPGNAGRFVTILAYETPLLAEAGRVQIDTLDPRQGRLAHRYTQDLVLLADGPDKIRPGHQGPTQLAILDPKPGAFIPQGTLPVSGGGWSYGEGRLLLQAWDQSGEILASTPLELSNGLDGDTGVFDAELEIGVSASQYGRLAVMEVHPATGEPRYLNSIEVFFQR